MGLILLISILFWLWVIIDSTTYLNNNVISLYKIIFITLMMLFLFIKIIFFVVALKDIFIVDLTTILFAVIGFLVGKRYMYENFICIKSYTKFYVSGSKILFIYLILTTILYFMVFILAHNLPYLFSSILLLGLCLPLIGLFCGLRLGYAFRYLSLFNHSKIVNQ